MRCATRPGHGPRRLVPLVIFILVPTLGLACGGGEGGTTECDGAGARVCTSDGRSVLECRAAGQTAADGRAFAWVLVETCASGACLDRRCVGGADVSAADAAGRDVPSPGRDTVRPSDAVGDTARPSDAPGDAAPPRDSIGADTAVAPDVAPRDGWGRDSPVPADAIEDDGSEGDEPPTVSITAPEDGAHVHGEVRVVAHATDDVGAVKVQFFVDNGLIAEDTSAPFAVTWSSDEFDEGPHTLKALAYDTASQTRADEVRVTVDRTPPQVTLLSPPQDGTYQDGVPLAAAASDDVLLERVDFVVDSGLVTLSVAAAPWEERLDAVGLPSGPHEVAAVAVDRAGNTASDTAGFVIDRPPTVRIVAPLADTTVAGPVTVVVAAQDDLFVERVTLSVDGEVAGTFDEDGQFLWAPPAGRHEYRLRAEVTDGGGQTAADEVALTVDPCADGATEEGAGCDDGDPCTTGDVCASGECRAGPPVVCEDGDPCTTHGCDPVAGCREWPVADGAACPGGRCVAGRCSSDAAPAGYVRIPAGSFTMGSPDDEPGHRADESPPHTVLLTAAYDLKATEVTQAEWRERMGTDPSYFAECGGDCPVEQVSWFEALAYCNALSRAEGLSECYILMGCRGTLGSGGDDGYWCDDVSFTGPACEGYRLPTEAEWEHAYRAGSAVPFYPSEGQDGTYVYPEGAGSCSEPSLGALAWFCGNSGYATHAAGTRAPNAWGLHDMAGNVWEWVSDPFGPYPSGPVTDPSGPSDGWERVVRGGAAGDSDDVCRAAARGQSGPNLRHYGVGFRPCRTTHQDDPPLSGCTLQDCNGHGICNGEGTACRCLEPYAGTACDRCAQGYSDYPACEPELTCVGAPRCEGDTLVYCPTYGSAAVRVDCAADGATCQDARPDGTTEAGCLLDGAPGCGAHPADGCSGNFACHCDVTRYGDEICSAQDCAEVGLVCADGACKLPFDLGFFCEDFPPERLCLGHAPIVVGPDCAIYARGCACAGVPEDPPCGGCQWLSELGMYGCPADAGWP